jgi:hypothetical protein
MPSSLLLRANDVKARPACGSDMSIALGDGLLLEAKADINA